jgi:hypothetical protein
MGANFVSFEAFPGGALQVLGVLGSFLSACSSALGLVRDCCAVWLNYGRGLCD